MVVVVKANNRDIFSDVPNRWELCVNSSTKLLNIPHVMNESNIISHLLCHNANRSENDRLKRVTLIHLSNTV